MGMTREFSQEDEDKYLEDGYLEGVFQDQFGKYFNPNDCTACNKDMYECECCPTGKHSSLYDQDCNCYGDGREESVSTQQVTPNGTKTAYEAKQCSNAGCDKWTIYGVCLTCDPNSHAGFSSQLPLPSTGTAYVHHPPHNHPSTKVIKGDGWTVSCGKGIDVEDDANDFNVVLNLTGRSISETHHIPIPELEKWKHGNQKYQEIVLGWPDYGVTTMPLAFWQDLLRYLEVNKMDLLVFCVGGHGRTGTAVASMLIAGLGYSSDEAIGWVRTNYCDRAIEGQKQEAYLDELWAERQAHDAAKKSK